MRPPKSNRRVARPCSDRLFQSTNETERSTGDGLMGNEGSYVALGLKTWNAQIDRADKLFAGLSSEEILREIAPGRNRLLYLWGHLTAVHDAMLPLLSLGERLHPEFDVAKYPSRNRFAILLSRTNHLSYHLGQAVLGRK